MGEPSKQLIKQAQRLFQDESDRTAFITALNHPSPFAPTILWTQPQPPEFDWQVLPPLPWQPDFVDRLAVATRDHAVEARSIAPLQRPGQHPLHEKGYFYCLD
ncbi:MAG: hypothetical protein AAFN08_09620, partial [Cyanobacteria bacterium J06559_3]